MVTERFFASADLSGWIVLVAAALGAAGLALLLLELRRREGGGASIALTGVLATLALVAAVVRPVRVAARQHVVGAKVVVLADESRSMALPQGKGTRADARDRAVDSVVKRASEARVMVLGFGDAAPRPVTLPMSGVATTFASRSDLAAALRALAASADERPSSVFVVSDGRLDDPPEGASAEVLRGLSRTLGVPVHAIATTRDSPPDASVRHVAAAGAVVAHAPFSLHVEVGCTGGLACDEVPVSVQEMREGVPAALLATGTAHVVDGTGAVDLTVTIERAGTRVLEVSIAAPPGDAVAANDRRLLPFHVVRDRVRVLHVAGRATADVRALREWLKSDASVDVVAFFILRTPTDDVHADERDLALIKFPVDELFSQHLPSFDAVVLQDFDAQPYGLERHLPALARYVRSGGGLIMVGGPNSFVGGGYADSPLGDATGVLPVRLDASHAAVANDMSPFEPSWTPQGRVAPLLAPLRAVVGSELPVMPGTNVLGDARPGSLVLWTHPTRVTPSGAPMPVLAVGEAGDGRTVALGVDGGWRLEFSGLGARTQGRGYEALWSGLLGWLMRDPRYEPAQVEVVGGCIAGRSATLRVHTLLGVSTDSPERLSVDVTRLERDDPAQGKGLRMHADGARDPSGATEVSLPPLEPGAYVVRARVGASGPAREELTCEVGGDEWADPRPDGARLRALAEASGGTFRWADEDLSHVPLPPPTTVNAERHTVPVAPPWVWTVGAALLLGAHWVARRRGGLA